MTNYTQTPATAVLHDAVAAATVQAGRRLVVRYVPVYAGLAVLLLIAAALPTRVPAGERHAPATLAQRRFSALPTSPAPSQAPPIAAGAVTSGVSLNAASPDARSALPPSVPADDLGPKPSTDQSPEPLADKPGGSGTYGPCPVEFGKDPQVSREVAAVLLSAASPALSVLGPFGPNAVPALALASPILPVLAPLADAAKGYIRLFYPLFLQISQFGTQLWAGPLSPLEAPLLGLNATIVQPFEVEVLASLSPAIEAVNATPATSCLQRLVYNVVTPVPLPEAPKPPQAP